MKSTPFTHWDDRDRCPGCGVVTSEPQCEDCAARPDFEVSNDGKTNLLTPLTARAHQWCDDHLDPETARCGFRGSWSYPIKGRNLPDILERISDEGMNL